jgi:hypothetical protein
VALAELNAALLEVVTDCVKLAAEPLLRAVNVDTGENALSARAVSELTFNAVVFCVVRLAADAVDCSVRSLL